MTQGLFGGATSYNDQSIEDIIEDINEWIDYTKEIKQFLEDGIANSKAANYWNIIPFDFSMTLLASVRCQNTFLNDFDRILNAISNAQLTTREVELLKKIGLNAGKYNSKYGITFKEDNEWKEYGDKNFQVVENMYAQGRDYFVTLQDAMNASVRLSDYINSIPQVLNQNINQTVSGNGNIITGINNGAINQNIVEPSEFTLDIQSALDKLEQIEDVTLEHKRYIKSILNESNSAVENGDLEIQSTTKEKMKSFLIGAGSNAIKIVHLLGTYASIASYYGL
ncbi:hypothetical protein [Paenibacillus sp. FSL L8-0506]|uniref:hypothetical protein n=1 Tax=Paenibacillus sp. FSL L8-0506 TaxID=2975335 RepID=UPI0030FC388B